MEGKVESIYFGLMVSGGTAGWVDVDRWIHLQRRRKYFYISKYDDPHDLDP